MNDFILAIWLHFLGDFILQSDKMAMMKSSSNAWLGLHVLIYSICLIPLGMPVVIYNGVAHFVIDWFTSRATTWLYKNEQRHWFFVVIGLDQALHMTVLLLTLGA